MRLCQINLLNRQILMVFGVITQLCSWLIWYIIVGTKAVYTAINWVKWRMWEGKME
jgi:uncharacterized membrane protein YuzA (DUF378 family)